MEVSQPKKTLKRLSSDVNCNNATAYRKFIKETQRSDISYEMFSKVPELVHEEILRKLKSGPYAILIPKLGVSKLIKVTPYIKGHALIDWGRYNKTKVWAPYRNNHSDGYVYKTHLYTYARKYPNLGLFEFKVIRKYQRDLAQLIKNNELNR